jgi:hypothetical protein
MASTRSINTPGNFYLKQQATQHGASYVTDRQFAYPNQVLTAGTGLIQGYMGNAVLAQNPQDIESFLFGIGANNLITPAATPFQAQIMDHSAWTMLDRRVPLVMPRDLVVEPNQRQYPLPSACLEIRR